MSEEFAEFRRIRPAYPRCFLGNCVYWIVRSPGATPEVWYYDGTTNGPSAQYDEASLIVEKEEYMGQVPPPTPHPPPPQPEALPQPPAAPPPPPPVERRRRVDLA